MTSHRSTRVKATALAFTALTFIAGAPSVAHAQGQSSRQPGGARIVVPLNSDITTTVLSKDAGDELAYGLQTPSHLVVCRDCQAGDSRDLGVFEDGQVLVFYLTDRSHHETFTSDDPTHARVVKTTKYTWIIDWDDAGGDGDYNDLVTYVKLSPT